jgi:hypothetical protein
MPLGTPAPVAPTSKVGTLRPANVPAGMPGSTNQGQYTPFSPQPAKKGNNQIVQPNGVIQQDIPQSSWNQYNANGGSAQAAYQTNPDGSPKLDPATGKPMLVPPGGVQWGGTVNSPNNPFYDNPVGLSANQQASQYQAQLDAQHAGGVSSFWNNAGNATGLNNLNNYALQQSTNNQLALNHEGAIQNGLDHQTNANNLGLLRTQGKLLDQQFHTDQNFINATWGLNNQQYAADQQNFAGQAKQLKGEYGFADRNQQLAMQQAGLSRDANNQSAMSQAASSGSLLAQGTGDNFRNIGTQYGIAQGNANLSHDQAYAQIGGDLRNLYHQQTTSQINHKGDANNFQHQLDTGVNSWKGNAAQINNAVANNFVAKQGLDSMAREFGIKATDLNQSLANAVQKNNLNLNQVIQGLSDAMTSGDNGRIQQYNQFMAQLINSVTSTGGSTSGK